MAHAFRFSDAGIRLVCCDAQEHKGSPGIVVVSRNKLAADERVYRDRLPQEPVKTTELINSMINTFSGRTIDVPSVFSTVTCGAVATAADMANHNHKIGFRPYSAWPGNGSYLGAGPRCGNAPAGFPAVISR